MTRGSSSQFTPSGDLWRVLVEQSVDGILVIDEEGFVRMANPAAVSLFAARTQELLGFQLGTPAIHEPVEIMLPGGKGAIVVEMRSTDIVWQGRASSLASLRDVTERKEAADAMQIQAEELQTRNNRLVSFNRAAVGRELRMIELKREVNELCRKLGEAPRYRLPGDESAAVVPPAAAVFMEDMK